MRMPEFSVIVPVYNVEKYIRRCVESILAQSYSDFELILVDDGSKDQSGKICDEYAENDSRIKVIHQKNQGVSCARNTGLNVARGKYIVFIDSDDEVELHFFSCLVQNDANFDLVISGVKHINVDNILWNVTHYDNELISEMTQQNVLKMLENKSCDFTHGKRFKKEIIEKAALRFDNTMSFGEDTYFVVQYLCNCNSIRYVNKEFYKYYKYGHDTLSSFCDDYVQRLEGVNEKIADVLNVTFGEIRKTLVWKKRCFSVYYYSIFFILRNTQYSFMKKRFLLKEICEMRRFREFSEELDFYMPNDSRVIRRIIATKTPLVIIIFWHLIELKKSWS